MHSDKITHDDLVADIVAKLENIDVLQVSVNGFKRDFENIKDDIAKNYGDSLNTETSILNAAIKYNTNYSFCDSGVDSSLYQADDKPLTNVEFFYTVNVDINGTGTKRIVTARQFNSLSKSIRMFIREILNDVWVGNKWTEISSADSMTTLLDTTYLRLDGTNYLEDDAKIVSTGNVNLQVINATSNTASILQNFGELGTSIIMHDDDDYYNEINIGTPDFVNASEENKVEAVVLNIKNKDVESKYKLYGEHNIVLSTTDLVAGTSHLPTGKIHLVYE